MAEQLGGGSHFLGVFDEEGHKNLGSSDDWTELDKFTARALSITAEWLKVSEAPEELHA
jgi:hypothetical protein